MSHFTERSLISQLRIDLEVFLMSHKAISFHLILAHRCLIYGHGVITVSILIALCGDAFQLIVVAV